MNPNTTRVKVGCINWGHDGAPKAIVYALRGDGEMFWERYPRTWAEAIDEANDLAALLAADMPTARDARMTQRAQARDADRRAREVASEGDAA